MSTNLRSSCRGRVLIADDEDTIRRLLEYNLGRQGFQTIQAVNGREAIAKSDSDLTCALVDLKMPEVDGMGVLEHFKRHHPEVPVIMISAAGQLKDAVAAMKFGAIDYISKPFDLDALIPLVRSAAKMGEALQENRELKEALTRPAPDSRFAGTSAVARKLLETVSRVAQLDSTLLIIGESGVGKGLIARMIHRASGRAEGPFITASCPALPRELLESEMFGHERGAFTGAHQRRIGRIEMAKGGTLFLDEIGDLPLLLQPKLLNVLQDRQFQRLGGAEVLDADARLIAATNVDLAEKVAAREFREDLYYRLNVIPIHIPPLRERLDDLPDLSAQILSRIGAARSKEPLGIDPEAMSVLKRYRWPGNIRELENVLERSAAFCEGDFITADDLAPELHSASAWSRPGPADEAGNAPEEADANGVPQVGGMTLEDLERLALQQTLILCGGNKAATARKLGTTEKSIYNKLTRLGLR